MKSNYRSAPLAVCIATWFGCGFFPFAPGTIGSLAAVALAWVAHSRFGWSPWLFLVAGALITLPGVWAADQTEKASGKKDPGVVVVDEVAGQWITLGGAVALNPKSWLLAFALFRIFDIWKPYPARKLEALHGGAGIMADDVIAGLYAALIMYVTGQLSLY